MKTIFTNDVEGTRKFMEAVGFVKNKDHIFISGGSTPDAIRPQDEYELKDLVEGDKPSQVLIQKGILGINDFFNLLVEDFDVTHIDTVEENPITQTVNLNTPFGFTFHVRVIFA